VPAAVVKDSDDGGMGTLNSAHDSAFRSPVRPNAHDFHQRAVAVHGGADRVRGNENIAREAGFESGRGRCQIRDHEAETVAMQTELACN